MRGKPIIINGWLAVIILAVLGCVGGTFVSSALAQNAKGSPLSSSMTLRSEVIYYPAAYQLPKMPGGTSLRMAMIHDVLLERYSRHGSAWNEKRVADARKVVETERLKGGMPSVAMLAAMDDMAVGLENLHKSEEAAGVMREKLKLMPAMDVKVTPGGVPPGADSRAGDIMETTRAVRVAASLTPEMRAQYTARANLGTSLIHGSFALMMAGDEAARGRMEEGVKYIRESMAINPGAHFGRETWQAIVVQHFLACRRSPELMTTYDMIGDDLSNVHSPPPQRRVDGLKASAPWLDAHASIEERIDQRSMIAKVGAEVEWAEAVHVGITGPVPFDEPALALMGMWMLGGGPSAHSALALANIAFQVGQFEIAWDGYERAVELQAGFSPDPETRGVLVAYCQEKQDAIARWGVERDLATDDVAWVSKTRQRHVEELAWALKYREEYQAWEAKQIAAGVGLEDAGFYDGFFKGRPALASPVGEVDESAVRMFAPDGVLSGLPAGLLAGGVLMLLGAVTAKRG